MTAPRTARIEHHKVADEHRDEAARICAKSTKPDRNNEVERALAKLIAAAPAKAKATLSQPVEQAEAA